MMRPPFLGSLPAAAVLSVALLVGYSALDAGDNATPKVKGTAAASKIGADGKQTVMLTLDIEKGWTIYADPVGNKEYESARTQISVQAKEKLDFKVQFPAWKVKVDEGLRFNVYVERVAIPVQVQRTIGDDSPLQISVSVVACDKSACIPQKFKLIVP